MPAGVFQFGPGSHLVRTLVDAAARHLGTNILYDGNATGIASSFDLQTEVRLESQEVEAFVGDILWARHQVMIPRDVSTGTYEIIDLDGPRRREVMATPVQRTAEEVLAKPRLRVPVTTTIELKHLNSNIATNALRPFFAAAGASQTSFLTFGTAGNPQRMLLSGLQFEVAQAVQTIQSLDAPPPDGKGLPSTIDRIDELERQLEAMQKRLDALEKRGTGQE